MPVFVNEITRTGIYFYKEKGRDIMGKIVVNEIFKYEDIAKRNEIIKKNILKIMKNKGG